MSDAQPKLPVTVIKRRGQIVNYSSDKLSNSIKAVCLSVRTPKGEAEVTAVKVVIAVEQWLATKSEVTSQDLRRKAAEALVIYNPDAAYIYKKLIK